MARRNAYRQCRSFTPALPVLKQTVTSRLYRGPFKPHEAFCMNCSTDFGRSCLLKRHSCQATVSAQQTNLSSQIKQPSTLISQHQQQQKLLIQNQLLSIDTSSNQSSSIDDLGSPVMDRVPSASYALSPQSSQVTKTTVIPILAKPACSTYQFQPYNSRLVGGRQPFKRWRIAINENDKKRKCSFVSEYEPPCKRQRIKEKAKKRKWSFDTDEEPPCKRRRMNEKAKKRKWSFDTDEEPPCKRRRMNEKAATVVTRVEMNSSETDNRRRAATVETRVEMNSSERDDRRRAATVETRVEMNSSERDDRRRPTKRRRRESVQNECIQPRRSLRLRRKTV